jgi:hypothetical protein
MFDGSLSNYILVNQITIPYLEYFLFVKVFTTWTLHLSECGGRFLKKSYKGDIPLLQNNFSSRLKCLNIYLPYDPAIPLLGIYLKECDSGYSRGTCTPMFIAVSFTIAKLWKQPRCPTTDEWVKKMWYLCTMEFYSATKKNEILFIFCSLNGRNWRISS